MALAIAITIVRNVELPAMQTPGLGSSFHRQTRKQPPKLEENAPKPRRKSPRHTTPFHKKEKKSSELKIRNKIPPRHIRSSNRPHYPISKSTLAPFSRRWEALLEDAHLVSATERADAEHDARSLEVDSWVILAPIKHRPHLIDRIAIPLAAEARWREAFGFAPPTESDMHRIREYAWERKLTFLREARISIPFAKLLRLNDFIKQPRSPRELVPIKERSLQIFGDEKRLDLLIGSTLFRDGRLDLARDLGCEVIGVPFGWKRGPAAAAREPIFVIENAATWHSYCRWNATRALFS
jgi:hypothetical protein